MTSRIGVLAVAGFVSCLSGCNDHPLDRVRYDRVTEDGGTVAVAQRKDVDILFVIDNSGSMGEEQATLAANFSAFVDRLEEVEANYRIAVTTTDANHAHCAGGEDGRFQMTSCRARTHEFQRLGTSDEANNFLDESCVAVCDLDTVETVPTTTLDDTTPTPRPWIEKIGGVTNLPEGVTTAQAFQCIGPQGVTGCGYESPLEAMRRSFIRAGRDDQPEAGFVRPGAILAVVFVTDEADCSAQWKAQPEAWDPDGDKLLWGENNRDNGLPGSEVCWFAGVECTDNGDGTQSCVPANKDAAGMPADPEDAVLHPLSTYTDFLQTMEDEKRKVDLAAGLDTADVLVGLIGGVPPGFVRGQEIPYRSGAVGDDVAFEAANGVAAGCRTEGVGEAVPPVRLAEFARAFATENDTTATNLFSVCQPDYSPALKEIADLLKEQVKPACVPVCVEDTDRNTEALEHNCFVTELVPDNRGGVAKTSVPRCVLEGDEARVPADKDICFVSRVDADESTPSTVDDLDTACVEQGFNLELAIVRRDGVREEPGSTLEATCSSSTQESIDCPKL